jgi:DNA-binding IclR family transcriptional regulator
MSADAPEAAPPSQTLSRGIRVLELLADAREALTIDDVARGLDVHRSIAYRLLRTLEHHGLVVRDAGERGHARTQLDPPAGVAHDLQAEALPELTDAANELGMTCFVAVLDHDECVTLVSVEPRHAVASVAQRPGTRHPVTLGAPGKAILSTLDGGRWPVDVSERTRAEVVEAAARGFATSHDEVIPSLRSVAVPLVLRGRPPASVAAVYVASDTAPERIAERLARAAGAVRGALGG